MTAHPDVILALQCISNLLKKWVTFEVAISNTGTPGTPGKLTTLFWRHGTHVNASVVMVILVNRNVTNYTL